jgi:hypothetical protein
MFSAIEFQPEPGATVLGPAADGSGKLCAVEFVKFVRIATGDMAIVKDAATSWLVGASTILPADRL